MIRALLAPLVLASSIALVAAPGVAETVSQTVRYADLDLASVDGQSGLHSRVAGAIRRMCGVGDPRDLNQLAQIQACRTSARNDADGKVARLIAAGPQLAARRAGLVVASR